MSRNRAKNTWLFSRHFYGKKCGINQRLSFKISSYSVPASSLKMALYSTAYYAVVKIHTHLLIGLSRTISAYLE